MNIKRNREKENCEVCGSGAGGRQALGTVGLAEIQARDLARKESGGTTCLALVTTCLTQVFFKSGEQLCKLR